LHANLITLNEFALSDGSTLLVATEEWLTISTQ
jgi:hypothetical protein